MKNRIIAVVVTYNRLNDVKNCINALKKQTLNNFDILIVNNGSNDGTKEYLDSLGDKIKCIHQENLGGAGGFYTGSKYAFDHYYDWIWMMDDDGLPHPEQLNNLMKIANKKGECVLNALVACIDDHSRFAFGRQELLSSINTNADIIETPFSPFNGTLIPRTIIEKVGFIKKEMFIWGDEQEYMNRIRKAGFQTYTVPSSVHYHPREKGRKERVLPIIKRVVLIKPSNMSHYFYRNLGYIDATYGGMKRMINQLSCYTIYLIRVGRFGELVKFYKYYFRGRKNNYR